MKLLKGMGIAVCLVVLCFVAASNTKANGQASNALVTFTAPVEVPGVGAQILPAGSYRFTNLESTPDRNIIQISSPDGSHVFTTMLGVPNPHLKAPDSITVMFSNRPAADPLALKAWYCPGCTSGDQIVYEQPRATQLAKEANEPVLSTSVVQPVASVEVLKTAVIAAVSPTGETVAIAQAMDAAPGVTAAPAVAAVPTVAPVPDLVGGSTAAEASSPAAAPVAATETTVAAKPASAIEPPATSATPASTDPAAAAAPTPIGEPAVAPAPAVSAAPAAAVVPVVAVAPVAPVEPAVAPAPVATAAPTVTAEPAVAPSQEVATATLPQTASILPLIGLVGLLMLGAGVLLTSLMKRRV